MPAPDVFVIPRADWREACESDEYLHRPPVLVVEIISRANRRSRILQKVDIYLSAGVKAVWVVYPRRRRVRIHQAGLTTELSETDSVMLPSPLQGSLPAQDIFRLDG
jgi:Uma2 family endonuclease